MVPRIPAIYILLSILLVCANRKALEGKHLDSHRVGPDDRKPLEEHIELDSDNPLNETTGPPFGIVINGQSLVRHKFIILCGLTGALTDTDIWGSNSEYGM